GAGAAGHEGDAGTAGQLAVRLGHHHRPALLAADGDGDIAVVEGVERRQIAFAGDTEDMADAVDHQLLDQHLAARAHIVLAAHSYPPRIGRPDTNPFRWRAVLRPIRPAKGP